MHEGMHGVLLPNRRWNWFISVLLGSTFLMSFSSYRVLHIRHHRYLGDPRDPDDYHNYARSQPMVWFLHFVRLTFGPILYVFLIPLLALKYGSAAQRKLICIEYTILFSIYSALLRMFPRRTAFGLVRALGSDGNVHGDSGIYAARHHGSIRSVPCQPDDASQSTDRVLSAK